jgi:hypothetical protein
MFTVTKLAAKYAIFALVATATNIGAQDVVIRVYNGAFDIPASMIVGTAVGLFVKYILDKRYIFGFIARDAAHDTQTFALYTVMGIVTTLAFWGFEFSFYHIFGTKEMRYVGGGVGLAIGYLTKYHLDKRFVFRMSSA